MTSAIGNLHTNFVAEINNSKEDLFDKYEIICGLGKGSMGVIQRVRIKEEAIGGSAFPRRQSSYENHNSSGRNSSRGERMNSDEGSEALAPEERRQYDPDYALKTIRYNKISPKTVKELKNEIAILKTLDHPHIVKAQEVYYQKTQVCLVMECCNGGNLFDRAPYSEKEARSISRQLLSAVKYMHDHGIVHRDLKYENVLFDTHEDDAVIKVIDFGLSKKFQSARTATTMTSGVGTMYTMAPEIIKGESYTAKVDLWSTGVIIYMLLSHKLPFYNENGERMVKLIKKGKYSSLQAKEWKDISKSAKAMVKSLLVVDHAVRLDATTALRHQWLRKAKDPNKAAKNNFIKQSIRQIFTPTRNFEAADAFDDPSESETGGPPSRFSLSGREDTMFYNVTDMIPKYRQLSVFKKVALNIIAHLSTNEEVLHIRKVFTNCDKDRNGVITFDELKTALNKSRTMKRDLPDDVVREIFDSIDVEKDGQIKYTEFIAASLLVNGDVEEQRIAEAFDRIDRDNSGFITKDELVYLLGANCNEKMIREITLEADADEDGKISYDEFLQAFRKLGSQVEAHIHDYSSVADSYIFEDDEDDTTNA